MYFKNDLLEPSETSLESMNIRNNSIIHIDVPDTRSKTEVPEALDAEFEKLCLIKVYHRREDEMLFSYWVPRRTTNTFASVFFKYWRYLFDHNPHQRISEIVPWTGTKDKGDGHLSGDRHDYWDKLSDFLNASDASGMLEEEGLFDCSDPPEALGDEINEDIYGEYGDVATAGLEVVRPLVLKVRMGRKRKTKRKNGKNLSRVS